MKFIKLTRNDKWNEGEPVCINTDCIVAVFAVFGFDGDGDGKRQIRVTTTDADGYFDVKESLEEIMQMIEGD